MLLLLIASILLLNSCTGVPQRIPSAQPTADLLGEAEQALQGGDYSRAELQVERALRIEPRDGQAWHLMARIRCGQINYGQTVQFCLKSNTLAGHDHSLRRQNWMLLEKAYTMLGETAKAKEARYKAENL